MALRLGGAISVECVVQEGKSKYTFPERQVIRFEFPARGSMPAVARCTGTTVWRSKPEIPGVPAGELLGDSDVNGSVFIGDKGIVTTGCYGERTRLIPASRRCRTTGCRRQF